MNKGRRGRVWDESYLWVRLFGVLGYISILDFVLSVIGMFERFESRELISDLFVKGFFWLLCGNRF